jgi:hypothetical protein
MAVLGRRNDLQHAKAELLLGGAVEQAQQLAVEPARTLFTPLPLGHHLRIDADPHAEVLPGKAAQLLGDLLLGQAEAVAIVLKPQVRDRVRDTRHGSPSPTWAMCADSSAPP